jgi:phosphoribosylanthranilate isomerase
MTDGIRLKVCGLTNLADAEFAAAAGADYLGFILHPDSPRYLSLAKFGDFAAQLPKGKKVAVTIEPTPTQLVEMGAAGFDFFQVHFRHDTPLSTVAGWTQAVGLERLWLAPKLPPGISVPALTLPLAKTFLFDTYHVRKFGGTGETGDWSKFKRHRRSHPKKTWILSGGLNPANIPDALRQSGARFVDVNSGVESAPGVKDHAKLQQFVDKLHERRA